MSLVVGIGAFGGGLWLLVESVEGLIKSLQAWALAAGLSGVLVGTLVLGFDVESTAAGVAATPDEVATAAAASSVTGGRTANGAMSAAVPRPTVTRKMAAPTDAPSAVPGSVDRPGG